MINAVVVDDEIDSIKVLNHNLKEYCPDIHISGFCQTVEEAKKIIDDVKPDVVFLDIDLGENTSFDLLNLFEEITFNIIFVTAHENYALKALKYAALDYLLKPIDLKELTEAVKKLKNNSIHKDQLLILKNELINKKSDRIALNTGKSFEIVKIDDIILCQADENYIWCTTTSSKMHINKSMREIEEILPEEKFFRIHKSFLINLNHIKSIHMKELAEVIMADDSVVPLAHKRKSEFYDLARTFFKF